MKKISALLATILSFIICLSGVSPAFAQDVSQPASRGITTFYLTPEQQASGVQVYQQLKYDVAIPNPDLSAALPDNVQDFPAVYEKVLAEGRKKNGINGSFTEGWFDFQASTAVTPGTNTLFIIRDPLGSRIYSVVAGLPASQCPLKINSTQIAFFDKQADAEAKAAELDAKGFLVYVSPVDKLTIKAFSQLFYDPATGKKKTNKDCFLVSGATEGVKVDFQKIFPLLPPSLQQPARQAPFEYFPRVGSFIYLVNARKTLTAPAPVSSVSYACSCTGFACGNNAIGGDQGDIFTSVSETDVKSKFVTNSNTGWTCVQPAKIRGEGGPRGCFCKGFCGNGGIGADPNFFDLGLSSTVIDNNYGGGKPGNKTGWLCGNYRGKFSA